MLREGSRISGRTPVVPVGPQPDLPEQGPRMIRQFHDPHAHPVPQATQAMCALVVSPGQGAVHTLAGAPAMTLPAPGHTWSSARARMRPVAGVSPRAHGHVFVPCRLTRAPSHG